MLFQLTGSIATMRIEGKIDGSLQAAVWNRLLSLPVPFFKQYSAGELAMRAMGVSQIRMILSGITLNTILSGIFSVFTFALLFYYERGWPGYAALVVLAALIIGYLVTEGKYRASNFRGFQPYFRYGAAADWRSE